MTQRTISKVLIAQEDLALGQGSVNQTRQGLTVPVTKMDLPWIFTTILELRQLDTTLYKHCILDSAEQILFYRYTADSAETVDDYLYIAPNVGSGQWKLVSQLRKREYDYDSVADFLLASPDSYTVNIIGYSDTYKTGTDAQKLAGPKGGHKRHKTGETVATTSVPNPANSTEGTAANGNASYSWDGSGREWRVVDGVLNPLMFGSYGDNSQDDTESLLSMFTYAHNQGRCTIDLLDKKYKVSGQITPSASASWESLKIVGSNAEIHVDSSSAVHAYTLYFESDTNMDFHASGFSIHAEQKVATPLHVDVRDASPSTLEALGHCYIDVRVYDAKKASSVTAPAYGISVIGAFDVIDMPATCIVDNVTRDNHASDGNECKGISIQDLIGTATVSATVLNVTTPDVDADGIAIFGRERGSPADPDDFIYKRGIVNILGATIKECEGRHVKVQTSVFNMSSCAIEQATLQMITQSVSIAAQYGNGEIINNDITYRKTSGGSSPFGSSHSVFDIANVLTDSEMLALVTDNNIKTEVVIPRVISLDVDNTAASSTAIKYGVINCDNNKVISIGDLAGSDNVTRAFIEFQADNIVDNDGVKIICNNCEFSGASGSRLIGYTGYNGTDNLKSKLFVEAINNTNNGNANAHVFKGLSGSNIGLIEQMKFNSNTKLDCFFAALNFNLNNLPGGTDFTYDIATSTVTSTPASGYPGSGTAWIRTGNMSSGGSFFPQELFLENGTKYWYRVATTWRAVI